MEKTIFLSYCGIVLSLKGLFPVIVVLIFIPGTPFLNNLEQGSGTFLTQRAMKAKYLEIYFSESHIIYFKTDAITKRATPGSRAKYSLSAPDQECR